MKLRLLAFYLPQYHPIPENDGWWGKGFTEWTNVAKAQSLFKGHYQPHLPADLGFYDLRVPEVREQQADLAREAGIEGFCYWHYWFGGKQLLERPFNEVLASGKPDFPFCLAWANQTWTGIWHGAPDRVLIEQTYPGESDHRAHFDALLPAFKDDRYIKVDGKPLFVIYKPKYLPDASGFIDLWQELARSAGLKGLFIVGVLNDTQRDAEFASNGFDAFTLSRLPISVGSKNQSILSAKLEKSTKRMNNFIRKILNRPHMFDFRRTTLMKLNPEVFKEKYFPCVISNWDNTPRSGVNGYVGTNSSPELFHQLMMEAVEVVNDYPDEQKIIFIKSWNEWAEGNYLEPDRKYGKAYLRALKEIMDELQ